MSASPVQFLFDPISPYARLAWHRIHDITERHGRSVIPIPVLLAALLDANGQLGPGEIPSKRRYAFRDALRTARVIGVELTPPPAHPFNPLLGLRIACAEHPAHLRRRIVDALLDAVWGGGPGLTDAAALADHLERRGLDGAALAAAAAEPEAKARLRANTDAALARGVFGVPTMLVDDEMFWGFDSLGHLDRHLRGERTYDTATAETWDALEAQATRRAARR